MTPHSNDVKILLRK